MIETVYVVEDGLGVRVEVIQLETAPVLCGRFELFALDLETVLVCLGIQGEDGLSAVISYDYLSFADAPLHISYPFMWVYFLSFYVGV